MEEIGYLNAVIANFQENPFDLSVSYSLNPVEITPIDFYVLRFLCLSLVERVYFVKLQYKTIDR